MGHPWKVAIVTIGIIAYSGLCVAAAVGGRALAGPIPLPF